MAYLNDLKLGVYVGDYIQITDITTYPLSTYARAELGLALFWSLDEFTTSGGDLSNANSWYIPEPENGTYLVRCFAVKVFTAGSYADHSIVWYDGEFYKNKTGGSTSQVPSPFAADWTLLATTDYDEFKESLIDDSLDVGYSDITVLNVLSPYTIDKQEEGIFKVSFEASASVRTLNVTTFNGTSVETYTLAIGATEQVVDLSDLGDNVYIFTILEVEDIYSYVIYELSELETIYKEMAFEVLKNDNELTDCNNVKEICCRHELNKLNAYMGIVLGGMHAESLRYLGVYTIDETRQDFINKIGDYLDKISTIIENYESC